MMVGHIISPLTRNPIRIKSCDVTVDVFWLSTSQLRSFTLRVGANSMFRVSVCLLCEKITLEFVSIICALW